MKRITSKILLVTMLATLTSCGSEGGSNDTTAVSSGESTTTAAPVTTELRPELPEKDYNGKKFNIVSFSIFDSTYVDVEEQNGDVLNDAIFERNSKIEELYNIEIVSTVHEKDAGAVKNAVELAVAASDNSVDLAFNNCAMSMSLTLGGYLTELAEVPYVDLTMPWWDQGAVRDLSIGGKNYFAASSLSVLADNFTSVMFFNKDLAVDYRIGDLYGLVRDNKWTYPTMYELSKSVAKDLDGNNIMDDKDQYGILTAAALMTDGMANGGETLFKKNKDDYPELSIGSQSSEKMAEFFYGLIADKENVLVCNRYAGEYADAWRDLLYPAFVAGRGLFCVGYSQYVNYFRDMKTDYGILPRPKFSEEQENYYSQVNYAWADMMTIPAVVEDLECSGIILEALAAESLYTVTPANYRVSIIDKQLRDEESKEMLEIAYASRKYDFGQFATGLTNLNSRLIAMAQNAESYSFASVIDTNKSALETGIKDFIENFEALNGAE